MPEVFFDSPAISAGWSNDGPDIAALQRRLEALFPGRFTGLQLTGEGPLDFRFSATDRQNNAPVAINLFRMRWDDPSAVIDNRDWRWALHYLHAAEYLERKGLHVAPLILAADFEDSHPLAIWESPHGISLDHFIKGGHGRPSRRKAIEVVPVLLTVVEALQSAHGAGFFFNWLRPDATWFRSASGGQVTQLWLNNLQLAQFPGAGKVDAVPPIEDTYGSPERVSGSASFGPAEDLYALGAMAYEALTGFVPYADEVMREMGATSAAESGERLRHLKVYRERPTDPHELDASIPLALSQLVLALLRKDPAARPSAAAIVQALEPMLPAGAKLKRAAAATIGTLAAVPQKLSATGPAFPEEGPSLTDLRRTRNTTPVSATTIEFDQYARAPLPDLELLAVARETLPLRVRQQLLLSIGALACVAALVLATPLAHPTKKFEQAPKNPADLALLLDAPREEGNAPKPDKDPSPESKPKTVLKKNPDPARNEESHTSDAQLPTPGASPDPEPPPDAPLELTPDVAPPSEEQEPEVASTPELPPSPQPTDPVPAPRPEPGPAPDSREVEREVVPVRPDPEPAPSPSPNPLPQAPIAGPIRPEPSPAGPPPGPKPLPQTPDGMLFDFSANEQQVWSVDISPDGRTIATGGANEHAHLWDIRSGTNRGALVAGGANDHINWVTAVAFNRTGRLLATGSEDTYVKLWDVSNGKRLLYTLKSPSDATVVRALTFSPTADTVYVGYGNGAGTIKILDASGLKERATKLKHGSAIRAMAVSANGKLLVTGGEDHKARIWDLGSGRLIATLEGHGGWVQAVAWNGKGLLATGSSDGKVRVWDTKGKLVETLPSTHKGGVYSVAFRQSDGRLLASGGNDGVVRLWDVTFKAEQGALKGHLGIVTSLAFSPSGKELVTATLQDLHDRRTNPNVRVYRVY